MLPSPSLSYCDCCGLQISTMQADCPRCGYPVDASREESFLRHAIGDLQRIVTYGGASLTITQLIQRYQARLSYLQRPKELVHPHDEPAVVNKQSETSS